MIRFLKTLFFTAVIVFVLGALTAYIMGIVPTSIGVYSKIYKASNVAMDGYDVVAYQFLKSSNKGDVRLNYKYNDNNWFFISKKHLTAFKAKPNKYIPQFGGYCTYTISKGFTYPPDPNVWYFYNGKLYFFKDPDAKASALEDWKSVLENANLHWN